jgi:hypothetical protein
MVNWAGLVFPAFATAFSVVVLIIAIVRWSKSRGEPEPKDHSRAGRQARLFAVLMLVCYVAGFGLMIYGVFALAARAEVPVFVFPAGGVLVLLGVGFTVLGWRKTRS